MTLVDSFGRGVVTAIDTARKLRPSTAAGQRCFDDGITFRREAQSWSDEQKREWSLRRLRAVVRSAARTSSFYRERFRSIGFDAESDFTFEDYAQLPVLERADVAAHMQEMLNAEVNAAERRLDGTGGSTGTPLQYVSGPEERGWRLSGQEFFLEYLGVPRGVRVAYLWGHHIDQKERTQWRERVRDTLTNRRWYDCFRLSPELLLRYHEDMQRYRPACLTSYASALDSLAGVLLERGLKADYPSGRIITGGEKLWSHQRERVEAAFAAPVHEQYGSREAGLIAMQLDPRRNLDFTIDFANAFVEPAFAATDADILLTKLHADAMPMLRYRMGDVGRFNEDARPGQPAFVLHEVLGRTLDKLRLPDGRWLHGIGIPHLMKDFPLREFQIRQNEDYSVDVLVVPNGELRQESADQIVSVLRQNLPGLPLQLTRVDAVPRTRANKWRPVVSLVPGAERDPRESLTR